VENGGEGEEEVEGKDGEGRSGRGGIASVLEDE